MTDPSGSEVIHAWDLSFGTGGSDLPAVLIIIGLSAVALVFAWLFMKLAMPIVVERLGS